MQDPSLGKLQILWALLYTEVLGQDTVVPGLQGIWGGSVSGEDNPWFLTGQLAHSKVPRSLLRGGRDQY